MTGVAPTFGPLAWFLIWAALVAGQGQGAGGLRRISSTPLCPTCQIQLDQVARLGLNDSTFGEWPQSLWIDRQGRYYFTTPNHGDPPVVLAPDGRLVGHMGRPGPGPGEFRAAAQITGDRFDTLFIADWAGRLNVFSPSLQFVRSTPFPAGAGPMLVLNNGHLLVNAGLSSRQSIGFPFHQFDRGGNHISSYGDTPEVLLPNEQWKLVYRIAPATNGGVWTARHFGVYRIERWTATIRDIAFLREPSWFIPATGGRNRRLQDPEPSRIIGLWQDQNQRRLLWVAILAPDGKRKAAGYATLKTPEGDVRVPVNQDQVWDTVLELIDPLRGRLVSSRRFDECFALASSDGRLVQVRERADGFFSVRIVRARLMR